jgi:16S rRNA processing protein RimM
VSSWTSSTETLVAGYVGRPHGLDGSFHVSRARGSLLRRGGSVLVAGERREVVRRDGTEERPILRLDGCGDRGAAERLRGEELRVPRGEAPRLEEGEFYAEELEGCAVHDGDRQVGVVRRLLALPSCEVLEVERHEEPLLLVPLVRDAVRAVDARGRRIDVDLEFLGEG